MERILNYSASINDSRKLSDDIIKVVRQCKNLNFREMYNKFREQYDKFRKDWDNYKK